MEKKLAISTTISLVFSFVGSPSPCLAQCVMKSGPNFGKSVLAADITGDGVQDLIVGAPLTTSTSAQSAPDTGEVWVYPSGILSVGTKVSDILYFGWCLAAVGRVLGSSPGAQIACGGYGNGKLSILDWDVTTGTVRILSSVPIIGLIQTITSVDLDGDGFEEVIVGLSGSGQNFAAVVSFSGVVPQVTYIPHPGPQAIACQSLATLGADPGQPSNQLVAFAGYLNTSPGAVFVYSLSKTGNSISAVIRAQYHDTTTGSEFGWSMVSSGPGEIVVSALYSNGAGKCYRLQYSSVSQQLTPIAVLPNPDPGTKEFGRCVEVVGDLDGLGRKDIVIVSYDSLDSTIYLKFYSMDSLGADPIASGAVPFDYPTGGTIDHEGLAWFESSIPGGASELALGLYNSNAAGKVLLVRATRVSSFGVPCGAGVSLMSTGMVEAPTNSVEYVVDNSQGTELPGTLVVGTSNANWGSIALPLSLHSVPYNCSLLVEPLLLIPVSVKSGSSTASFPVPAETCIGRVYLQYFTYNGTIVSASNGLEVDLGW